MSSPPLAISTVAPVWMSIVPVFWMTSAAETYPPRVGVPELNRSQT